jgi:glyoxylase-like metal-dependent hydrolase (beta-lactamase superfamily II)
MKNLRIHSILFVMITVLCAGNLCAQQQKQQPAQYRQQPEPLKAHKVTDNFYEIKGGSGANTGFIITDKEVFAIDAKMTAESAQEMLAAIKRLSDKPITHVLITHSDGDHVNGLVGFPEDITIVAHSNTWTHMAPLIEKLNADNKRLTGMIFHKQLQLVSGQSGIQLLYFGPAHTDGDVIVFSPQDKTVFIGDLIFIGRDPLIHKHKNGTSFGLVKVLTALLELDVENFLHGHGDMATRSEVEAFRDALVEKQRKIAAMIEAGKTLQDVKKAYQIEDPPPRKGRTPRPSLVEIIYTEITEGKRQSYRPQAR